MIQRGKRIIVVESSVSKNGHPNVGDIGYLDNAYLFPKQRFILADAFFYQYKKDATKSKTRLEKKVFIIDLNMNKSLKNKIQKSGISKKYFSDNNNVINLTAVGFDPHSEFHDTSPQIFDHCGLWTSSNLNPVKIPFVHIADANCITLQREKISEIDKISAWFACFEEVFRKSRRTMISKEAHNVVSSCIEKHVKKVHNSKGVIKYTVNKISPVRIALESSRSFVKSVRFLEIILDMEFERYRKSIFNWPRENDLSKLAIVWNKSSIFETNRISNVIFYDISISEAAIAIKVLRFSLFRALFVSPNTYRAFSPFENFLIINNQLSLFKSHADFAIFCEFCDKVKSSANQSSAALTRILDRLAELESKRSNSK